MWLILSFCGSPFLVVGEKFKTVIHNQTEA